VEKMKDWRKQEKIDNKQRKRRFYTEAFKVWGVDCKAELGGILVESVNPEEEEERRYVQESHNARHVLWFLSMISYFIINDRPGMMTAQKTVRVLGHLICLREFLRTDQGRLRSIVVQLLEAVLTENPGNAPEWTHFIYHHWFLIREFAAYYGQGEKCFPFPDYEKVRDVVMGLQHIRIWWWELKTKRAMRKTAQKIRFGKEQKP